MPKTKAKTEKIPKEKKSVKVKVKKEKEEKPEKVKAKARYLEDVGRRKTAIARVRISARSVGSAGKSFLVNERTLENYFPTLELQEIVLSPFKLTDCLNQFDLSVRIKGGGVHAQAEAVRHGISKCLVVFNPDSKKRLKKAGYLTRDPRMRERKKFGLKRARRAPQWAKR